MLSFSVLLEYLLLSGFIVHSRINSTVNSDFGLIAKPSDNVPFDGFITKYSLLLFFLNSSIILLRVESSCFNSNDKLNGI